MHTLDGINTLERLCRLVRDKVVARATTRKLPYGYTISPAFPPEITSGVRFLRTQNGVEITFGVQSGTSLDYERVAEIRVYRMGGTTNLRLQLSGSTIYAENRGTRVNLAAAGNNDFRHVHSFYNVAADVLAWLKVAARDA